MLNLQQITTFVTVISEGSMTAAADKLYLTQPAVSQQIRNLEDLLGVELLVRGVRQVKATPQGEIFYEHAKRIMQNVQNAEVAIKSIGAQLKGRLRIGTINSIGLHLMSPLIGRLMKFNPELSVQFEYGNGEELIKQYKKNQLDVLILPETQKEFSQTVDNSNVLFLQREEMWLVGSSKETHYPHHIQLKDLNQNALVQFTNEFPAFNKELNAKLGSLSVNCHSVFESSNVGTLKRVIESGLGWGFLPAHSVRKQVKSGRLTRILIKDFSYEYEFQFYYKKNTEMLPVIEIFYQSLVHQEKGQ